MAPCITRPIICVACNYKPRILTGRVITALALQAPVITRPLITGLCIYRPHILQAFDNASPL